MGTTQSRSFQVNPWPWGMTRTMFNEMITNIPRTVKSLGSKSTGSISKKPELESEKDLREGSLLALASRAAEYGDSLHARRHVYSLGKPTS